MDTKHDQGQLCSVCAGQEEFQRFIDDSSFLGLRCVRFQTDFGDEDNRGSTGTMNYSTRVTQLRMSSQSLKPGSLDATSSLPSVMRAPELSHTAAERPGGKHNLTPL